MSAFSARKRPSASSASSERSGPRRDAPISEERKDRELDQLVSRFSLSLSDKYDRECVPIPIKDLHAAVEAGKQIMMQRRKEPFVEMKVDDLEASEAAVDAEEENDAFTASLCKQFEQECKVIDDSQSIQTRAELSADLLKEQRRSGGDQRLEAIRHTLNSLGYTRSHFQKARLRRGRDEKRGGSRMFMWASFCCSVLPQCLYQGVSSSHLWRRLGTLQRESHEGAWYRPHQAGSDGLLVERSRLKTIESLLIRSVFVRSKLLVDSGKRSKSTLRFVEDAMIFSV